MSGLEARTQNPIYWQGHMATRIAHVALCNMRQSLASDHKDAGDNRDEAR